MTRTLPNHVAAEASVLGGILLRNAALDELPDLEPGDFYDPRHRLVFTAIRNLEAAKAPIDQVTLEEEISRNGHLDAIGGPALIGELTLRVPTSDNVLSYARLVRRAAAVRAVVLAAAEIVERGYEQDLDADDFLDASEAAVIKAATRRGNDEDAKTMAQLVRERFRELDEIAQARERGDNSVLGVPTGIVELDAAIGGWSRGVVNLIAARPAMGKSSAALAAADACILSGEGVHVFTLEDSGSIYADRGMARRSTVPANLIGTARLRQGDLQPLTQAVSQLAKHQNWLVDARGGLTAREIIAAVRRHRERNKTGLVVVDYVQLVRRNPRLDENAAIDEIMTAFAAAAKEGGCRVAWLVLSQLNRDCEKRPDKRPQLADLRGSGSLEERAKVVAGLYRGAYYSDTPQRGVDFECECNPRAPAAACPHTPNAAQFERTVQVCILKKNMGATGHVYASWNGPTLEIR